VLLSGVGGGAGCIGGISRFHVECCKRWEKAVHMLSCVKYVTNLEKHFMFVKQTLTYLTINTIIWWRRGQDSGRDGSRGEDRGLGKARVRLN